MATTTHNPTTKIKIDIPSHNLWWEVLICVISQVGNLYRPIWLLQLALLSQDNEPTTTDIPWLLFQCLLVLISTWLVADLIVGVYHWFADSYRSLNAVINAIFFDNFQIHHEHPTLIAKRPLCNANWEVNVPSFVITIRLLQIHFTKKGMSATTYNYWFFISMLAMWVSWTNQAHRWAHQPTSQIPTIVQLLQRWGVFISPQAHRQHHQSASSHHPEDYCILCGICNPLLHRLQFWRRLELLVYQCTGIPSYSMLKQDPKAYANSPFGTTEFKLE